MHIRGSVELQTIEHRILRRIAMLGVGFGIIGMVQLVWMLGRRPFGALVAGFGPPAFPWRLVSLSEMLIMFAPVLLLSGAIGLFRWRGWGRVLLMIWGLLTGSAMVLNRAAMMSRFIGTPNFGAFGMVVEVSQGLIAAAYPFCTFLLLRRREFRDVFSSDAGRGFTVLLPDAPDAAVVEPAGAPMRVEAIHERDVAGMVARIVGAVGLALAIVLIHVTVWTSYRHGFRATLALDIWLGAIGIAFDLLFRVAPLLLLLGSLGLLRRREWGRKCLLAWAICYVASGVMYWGFNVAQARTRSATQPGAQSAGSFALDVAFSFIMWHAFGVVVLVILWGWSLCRDTGSTDRPAGRAN